MRSLRVLETAGRILDRPPERWALIAGMMAAGLFYLSYWAGVPQKGLPAFLAGVVLLVGFAVAYAFGAWLLLLRPLGGKADAPTRVLSNDARLLLAAILAVGTLCLTIGGFWDEVWHRKYGLPFGEDLFWRPHLLIYFGLLVPPALAAVSLAILLLRGKGSLRRRLRADPGLGFLALLGGFLLFTVPADPIWHTIYGADISAWSLPHLVLMISAVSLALLGSFFVLNATRRPKVWASVLAIRPGLVLVLFAGATSILAQVLIGDFARGNPMVPLRPAWLLPALMTVVALLMGTLANHATQAYGAAAALGVLTVLIRFVLVEAFEFRQIRPESWLPLLPLFGALDLAYAYRIRRGQGPPSPLGTGLASLGGAAVLLVLIPLYYDFPPRGAGDVGLALAACLVAGTAASWLGRILGDALASGEPAPAARRGPSPVAWAAPALFTVSILAIVYLIATATPPSQFF